MAKTQMALLLQHLEAGGKDWPFLASLHNHGSREVGHVGINQRLNERALGIHRLLLGGGDRLHRRLVVILGRSTRIRRLGGGRTGERERRERKN